MSERLFDTLKRCTICRTLQPISRFGRDTQRSDGLYPWCRSCRAEKQKQYLKNETDESRQRRKLSQVRHIYGVELDIIKAMYEQQEGACAICGTPGHMPWTGDRSRPKTEVLCVDHDHETEEIRGLLCWNCNRGLGQFGDSLEKLVRAANYLSRGGAQ